MCLTAAAYLLILCSSLFVPSSTETAEANGDTRTLRLYHNATKESIEATYRVNGHYDPAVLEKLNWFLRDWRINEATHMDPRLFDVIWEVYRSAGATEPITVYSAYRSPQTNAMLRRRSRAVAEHSQHMLGKAMDTTMPGMSMEKIREIGMRLQRGGVGYYQHANFVHLDVGNVRSWPRMSYDQLARLFPDGKTVHVASNGQTLPGYEEARAEIAANGGGGYAPPAKSKSFFAWLFGGKDEDEAEEVAAAAPSPSRGRTQVASLARATAAPPPPVNYANASSLGEDGGRNFVALASSSGRALQERPAAAPSVVPPPPASEAPTQVADLGPTAHDGRASRPTQAALPEAVAEPVALLPMPPHRPLDLIAEADVPLPPIRPVALLASLAPVGLPKAGELTGSVPFVTSHPKAGGKPDAIAGLINATTVAPVPHASLPGVITHGSDRRAAATVPAQVLAYAAPGQIRGLRSAALGRAANHYARAAASENGAVVPARLDRSNFRSMTASTAAAQTTTQAVLGASVTGLRSAARAVDGTFSNHLSADYVSRFGVAATNLDTSHFAGPAVQPLSSATGALVASSAFRKE